MSDTVNVEPTPIQRNERDVAIELTNLYFSRGKLKTDFSFEDIRNTYCKFYATVKQCEVSPDYGNDYNNFIQSIINEFDKEE